MPFRTRLRVYTHTTYVGRFVRACIRVRVSDIRGCRSSSNAPDGSGVSSPLLSSPLLFLLSSSTSSSILHPSPFQTDWGKAAGFAYIRRHTRVRFNISGRTAVEIKSRNPDRCSRNNGIGSSGGHIRDRR